MHTQKRGDHIESRSDFGCSRTFSATIESYEVLCRKLVEFDGYLFTFRLTLLNQRLEIKRLVNGI
jgi:hypothetical protein